MRSLVIAALTGVLFGLGLLVSGMTVPARVTGFLDVTGAWDPTLAFVMAGAIAIHAPLARLVRSRQAPLFSPRFHLPALRGIDPKLIAGAALFGVGWGLSGYCPGPALVSVGGGTTAVLAFVGAMLAGIVIARTISGTRT